MSVVTITIAIIGIIAVCVTGIYIAQSRERARIEKIQKIKRFSDRHERLQRLMHELPPQYLTDELRGLLVKQSIDSLNHILNLKRNKRLEGYLEADEQYLSQLQNKTLKLPPVPIKSPEQAAEVRSLLELLFKFVQQQAKQKLIDPGRAKQYALQIKFGVAKSRADGLAAKADQALKSGKPRVAIHAYHTALEAFKSMADYPKAAEAIALYKAEIKKLEETADQHNKELHERGQADENGQWDEFLKKDDDDWKKKNAYDD